MKRRTNNFFLLFNINLLRMYYATEIILDNTTQVKMEKLNRMTEKMARVLEYSMIHFHAMYENLTCFQLYVVYGSCADIGDERIITLF